MENAVLLCDACHSIRHPNLQVSLARRMLRRWAVAIAVWLDRNNELPIDAKTLSAMERFGVTSLREGQLEPIMAALRGESCLVVRPTGSGKSLCFQLPALIKAESPTYVLSPLKALMVDQVNGLSRRRIPATFFNSDIPVDERKLRFAELEDGTFNLVYFAPERFNPNQIKDATEIERLASVHPSFLVVDEAHVIKQWGSGFRTDYGRIKEIREKVGNPPVLAFTATASHQTQAMIKESMGVPEAHVFFSDVDRPNIGFARVAEGDPRRKTAIVAALVGNHSDGRAMVFVPTKKVGEEVAGLLREAGIDNEFVHGGLAAGERSRFLMRFSGEHEPDLKVIVCTSALSMGLDIQDVRVVVHWQQPSSVEQYAQEFGRAGRDGEPAVALIFTDSGNEKRLLEFMAEKSAEDSEKTVGKDASRVELKSRLDEIDLMSDLLLSDDGCFRESINGELMADETGKKSIPMRLVESTHVEKQRVRRSRDCCDYCSEEMTGEILNGSYRAGVATPVADAVSDAREATTAAGKRAFRWMRRAARWLFLTSVGRKTLAFAAAAAFAVFIALPFANDVIHPDATIARSEFKSYARGNLGWRASTEPVVTRSGTLVKACGKRRVRNPSRRTKLCVMVEPNGSSGKIVGTWQVRARSHHAVRCTGLAKARGVCRPKRVTTVRHET